jgi:dye decolorizing peroxidase
VDRPPPQLRFTAYDLADPAIAGSALQGAFQRLSSAAAQLMAGRRIAEQGSVSTGSTPAGLQITIGVGERVIRAAGATLPGPMAPIPPFPGEDLDAAASGGDLAISVCGDDPLLTSSAARALGTLLAAWFRPRWTRSGFLPAATEPGSTPRNLMGQLDGTDNPAGARQDLAVWVAPGADVAWMADGTYLVCRRIRMKLAAWDGLTTAAKQRVIGRELVSGAPLSGGTEHSTPSFTALDAAGTPVIPADAHIRLSHPAHNAGATMMRRGYSYDDGYLPDGQPRAGLFFQAFQTDPRATFVPIQRRLASTDALSAFTVHETSALFAVLPGASQGGFVGETLFLG